MKNDNGIIVKFSPNDRGNPPGKLADAELHFGDGAGPLAGLKLIGFGIWERRNGTGRNVTFPARQYSVNGERRSFALLRPVMDASAQDTMREFILNAWEAHQEAEATAVHDAECEAREADRAKQDRLYTDRLCGANV